MTYVIGLTTTKDTSIVVCGIDNRSTRWSTSILTLEYGSHPLFQLLVLLFLLLTLALPVAVVCIYIYYYSESKSVVKSDVTKSSDPIKRTIHRGEISKQTKEISQHHTIPRTFLQSSNITPTPTTTPTTKITTGTREKYNPRND